MFPTRGLLASATELTLCIEGASVSELDTNVLIRSWDPRGIDPLLAGSKLGREILQKCLASGLWTHKTCVECLLTFLTWHDVA